jgi:hypothetical protein
MMSSDMLEKSQKELQSYGLQKTSAVKDSERRHIKTHEAIKVHSDDNYCIVIPKTHRAAKIYSRGTMWCTTDAHCFEGYDFPLFIIIDKHQRDDEGRQKKYQLHFETEGFKNEMCEDENFPLFLQENSELKELFTKLIQENVYKNYRDVETMLSMDYMQSPIVFETPIVTF